MSKEEPSGAEKEQGNHEAGPDPDNANTARATRQKRKKPGQPTILTQTTLRKPAWTYLHLALHASPPISHQLDASTARLHLTSALRQFLGLTGEAIPVDFLKLDGQDLWVRVPREDGAAVIAALGGWVGGGDGVTVGWRVRGRDDWLARLSGGDGMDLFTS